MPSSEFVPLGGATPGEGGFRPLGPSGGTAPAVDGLAPLVGEPETPAEAVVVDPPTPAAIEDDPVWQAGCAAGRAAARRDVEAMEATLARSLEQLAAFQKNLRTRYERELLMVALGVARKVVQHELQERPEIWLGMIRAAIRQAVDREQIVVRLPPALADALQAQAAALREGMDDVRDVQVVGDPALPPGGCVVESRWGDVDIGVDTQLEAAEHALLRAER